MFKDSTYINISEAREILAKKLNDTLFTDNLQGVGLIHANFFVTIVEEVNRFRKKHNLDTLIVEDEKIKLIEDALKIAHQNYGYTLWDIKDALENVLIDVNNEIKQCKVNEFKEISGTTEEK